MFPTLKLTEVNLHTSISCDKYTCCVIIIKFSIDRWWQLLFIWWNNFTASSHHVNYIRCDECINFKDVRNVMRRVFKCYILRTFAKIISHLSVDLNEVWIFIGRLSKIRILFWFFKIKIQIFSDLITIIYRQT